MTEAHPFIDAQGESRRLLVALDGRIKLVLLVAALLLNLTAGGVRTPLLLLLLAAVLVRTAGVPAGAFYRRMLMPTLLAAVALVTQLFWFRQGAVLVDLQLGPLAVLVTAGGLARGLEIALRILGGMGVLLFFSLTTPLPELLRAARFFRVPPVLVELALIMYRYIFLLLEEGTRIRGAQRSRLGFVDLRSSLRSGGILGGMLVLRSYDRAERSFSAMRCRGYSGALPAQQPGPVPRRDWALLALGLLLLLGLYTWR
jgi:cobalt/nickel transport system permease protein